MINLEYKFTQDVAIEAGIEISKSSFKGFFYIHLLGIFMLLSTVIMLFKGAAASDLLPLIVMGLLFTFIMQITKRSIIKNFKNNPSKDQIVKWTITEEQLTSQTGLGKAEFRWKALHKVEEKKNGFLLFQQPKLAHWIPKSAFSSSEDLCSFKRYAAQKEN